MSLPKVQILVVCDMAVTDAAGKMTVYGVFDRLASREFPAKAQMAVVWQCSIDEDGVFDVDFFRPNGEKLVESPPTLEAKLERGRSARGVMQFARVELPEPGVYRVVLIYNKQSQLSEYWLEVVKGDERDA